jgi:hypothetical protein
LWFSNRCPVPLTVTLRQAGNARGPKREAEKKGAFRPRVYLVPKILSPASPRPGKM